MAFCRQPRLCPPIRLEQPRKAAPAFSFRSDNLSLRGQRIVNGYPRRRIDLRGARGVNRLGKRQLAIEDGLIRGCCLEGRLDAFERLLLRAFAILGLDIGRDSWSEKV